MNPLIQRHHDVVEAYERHRDALRAFFDRLARRKDSVDDLLQEVYVQIRRYPPKEQLRDPGAYLFRVAWHVLQEFQRRARRQPETHDHRTLDHISRRWSPGADAEASAEELLLKCLRELPPAYGAVLMLRAQQDLSYTEIGDRLNISTSQVRRYLGIALAHLKQSQWRD